ncbi:beta-lactamase family protein [Dyadobacter sp. CY327]|uniref:serine hydrolase domain-containing protein n=1 Tax=Dyadobacter sp. CY327 TaxID=2907301 RepID=UPI001F45822A|nr:serine hydrolase domain-containing protein [Dyadobacter sp. CY327]MCE7071902.1 beta-lactamase family protein [Dyadobacter sp. CY327]
MIKKVFCALVLAFLVSAVHAQIKTLNGNIVSRASLDQFLASQVNPGNLPGLSIAIINNGKIVYHRSMGTTSMETHAPLNDQSIFEAASLSKTVFTYFVLRLVDQGILNLDTPLYKYMLYEDISGDERYKLITARMVLEHTSGLPNWRTSDLADSARHIAKGTLYLKFKPGTAYAYSGEGYYYLSRVIAKITKNELTTLDVNFQKEVSIPLGMSYAWFSVNPFITSHKVTGYMNGKAIHRWPGSLPKQDSTWFGAAGGLHTEAVSYANFLIALMKGHGLKKGTADELFKVQVTLPADGNYDGDTGWGLGIGIRPGFHGTDYNHRGNNGNFQSYYRINRAKQSGYVFFTNCDKGGDFNERLEKFFLTGK